MKDNILISFGKIVRKFRVERGISQEDFAELCELHRTYISDIELGKRNVSLENIARIARAFNITISELFLEVDYNNESV